MKLCMRYFNHDIVFKNGCVSTLEIENKDYFYRIINDLTQLENSLYVENIQFLEDNGNEFKHLLIKVIINYFSFNFDSTKMNNYIVKQIISSMESQETEYINKEFQKICKCFVKILEKLDLPLAFCEELNMESFIKLLKIHICSKNKLINNLLLIIDINTVLEHNDLLIFVNLKQYLTKEELIELYKYSVYNEVRLLLIDSQPYGPKIDYENKLLIDENLDEFEL